MDDKLLEPYEFLAIDCEENYQGSVMEELGQRKAELLNMIPDGKGRVNMEFMLPARSLIGFRSQFLTLTSGTGIMSHVFDHYDEMKPGDLGQRKNLNPRINQFLELHEQLKN